MTNTITITKNNLSEYKTLVNFDLGYAYFLNEKTFYGSPEEYEEFGSPSMAFVNRDKMHPGYRKSQDDFSLKNAGFVMPHLASRDGRAKFKAVRPAPVGGKPFTLQNHVIHPSEMSPEDFEKYNRWNAIMNRVNPNLTHSDDQNVLTELEKSFGGAYTVSNFIPQQPVIPKGVVPDINKLYDFCVNVMLVLQQKGVSANDTVNIGGSDYGQLFVGAVVMFLDLFYAMDNKFTFLSRMPKWYWQLRSTLMNVTVGSIAYYWELNDVGDIAQFINSAPMNLIGNTAVSIAPIDYSAGFTPDGQYILSTTYPVINVDDFIASGSEFMAQLMQQNGVVRVHTVDQIKPIFTAASFAQRRPFSPAAYPTITQLVSEVAILSKHYKYSGIGLANMSQPRAGMFTYTIVDGPAQLMFEIHDNASYGYLNIVPVPVSLTDLLAHLCTTIVGRDIFQTGNNVIGTYTQSTTSMALGFGPGQFIQYISYLLARFRMANTVLITTQPPQDGMYYVPPGSKTWFPTDDVSVSFPQVLIESLSKLAPIIKPVSRGTDGKTTGHELRLPYLFMNGTKTYANPLDNSSTLPSNSLLSIFKALFPNATCSVFNFGSVGGFPSILDITFPGPEAFFYGPGCTTAKNAVADAFAVAGQNMTMYSWAANVDSIGETLAYYYAVVSDPNRSDLVWDNVSQCNRNFVANKFAFDPNEIDNIMRILPVFYVNSFQVEPTLESLLPLFVLTGTYASMKAYGKQLNLLKNTFVAMHNIYFQGGSEQALSDNAKIIQHTGGGFFSSALSKLISNLPTIGKGIGTIVSTALKGPKVKGKPGVKNKVNVRSQVHWFPDLDDLKTPEGIAKLGVYHPLLRLSPRVPGGDSKRLPGNKQIRVIH